MHNKTTYYLNYACTYSKDKSIGIIQQKVYIFVSAVKRDVW